MRHLPLLLLCAGCTAPNLKDAFQQFEMFIEEDPADAADHFIEVIDSARDTLYVAIPAGEDVAVTDAVIQAWEDGVDVEVVTDIDQADDPGVQAMIAAEVPLYLADGEITYFDFNENGDVSWDSDQTLMSHAFAVADGARIVNATTMGALTTGPRVVFAASGETLVEDILGEHNQVFGGADATSTTAYDGLAKSITDTRWLYATQSAIEIEVWFGPQERLTKRIIDAVYSARASIHVITNDFANEGLARALDAKAKSGFEVGVIVGPAFGSSSNILSRVLTDETPNLDKYQVSSVEDLPTMVLIDYGVARNDRRYTTRGMVLSHDLYSAARLHRGTEVVNDQLIDGNLWVVDDYDEPSAEIEALHDLWTTWRDQAEVL